MRNITFHFIHGDTMSFYLTISEVKNLELFLGDSNWTGFTIDMRELRTKDEKITILKHAILYVCFGGENGGK